MAAGLGAESQAAKFRASDGLEGQLGLWLLKEVAGGDVEAGGNLTKSRQIPLIRTAVGEKLNMEDTGTSWYPKGKSVANRALLRAGLEVDWAFELLRPRVVHGGRMKGRHKPSDLQTHHELLASLPHSPTQASCTPALAHPPSLDIDRTRNATRAHFYPQHWLLCHMGFY